MILYFDNFVTDMALKHTGNPMLMPGLTEIRESKTIYAKQKKVDICAYSILSYSQLDFSYCLFNIKTETKKDYYFLKNIILDNYNKNKIELNNYRSDNYINFKKSLDKIKKKNDKWIFVMGNTDYPLMTHNPNHFKEAVQFADKFYQKFRYISIMPASQLTYLHYHKKNIFINHRSKFPYQKFYENKKFLVLKSNKNRPVHTLAIQVMNIKMLETLIETTNFNKSKIFRTDEMDSSNIDIHLMIVPKKRLIDHYDGYMNNQTVLSDYSAKKYPPLFIPKNFFKKKFNIYYGYKKRFENGVNINPLINKFSFEDERKGTDLKIRISTLPYFWKSKINKIIINKNTNRKQLEKAGKYYEDNMFNVHKEYPIWLINLYIFYLDMPEKTIIKIIIKKIKKIFNILIYIKILFINLIK